MASTYINLPQVGLEDESLLALENITVTVGNEIEIKNDSGNPVPVTGTVSVTGVATEVTLQAVLTELGQKTEPTDTQPISAASLPLPTGASTAANQATIIGHIDGVEGLLTSIDSKLTSPLAVSQSGTWNIADITGTVSLPTGAATAANQATIIGHIDGLEGLLTTIEANQLPDNHQVLANQSGTWNINNITGTVSLPTGAATAANQTTIIGHVDGIETLLSNIDAGIPAALGQTTMSASMPVVIASDQSPVQVLQTGVSTASVTSVAGSASSVTLLASNSNRVMAMFYNDSSSEVYIKFGSAASATSFTVKLLKNEFYEMPAPAYTGIVTGIWGAATGSARITEVTK